MIAVDETQADTVIKGAVVQLVSLEHHFWSLAGLQFGHLGE